MSALSLLVERVPVVKARPTRQQMQASGSPFRQGVVDTTRRDHRTPMRRGIPAATAAVLACGVALAGCSSGGDDRQAGRAPKPSPSASASTDPAPTQAVLATVTGRLPADRRAALTKAVTAVVDGWLEGAYLGDFPRSDYAPAFAGFTAG